MQTSRFSEAQIIGIIKEQDPSRTDSSVSTACKIRSPAPVRTVSVSRRRVNPCGSGTVVMVFFFMWDNPFFAGSNGACNIP